MKNIQIIQPILTEYRKNLFDSLIKKKKYNLLIYFSSTSPFGNSIKLIKQNKVNYYEVGRWTNILNIFFWQSNLKIDKRLTKGDVLIICGSLRHLSLIPLIINAKLRSIKVVWWSHGRSIRPAPFFDKIRRSIMRLMDSVILYTEEEYKSYLKFGFNKNYIFYMNNTINENNILKNKKKWNQAKLKDFKVNKKLSKNAIIFLFCGRLRSNPDTLLHVGFKAFRELIMKNKQCYYIIIGAGPKLNYYKNLAKQLGIEKNVIFVGEEYSEHKLAPYFLISDFFLYPGYIGLSLIHSLWYGVPIITHDNELRHAPEYTVLKENYNSIKYRENDHSSLAKKLIMLSKDRKKIKKYKKQAFDSVNERWTFKQMVENYHNAINSFANIDV